MKADLEASSGMSGENKQSQSKWMHYMIISIISFVACIFGMWFYTQQINNKEIQTELRTIISNLEKISTKGQKKLRGGLKEENDHQTTTESESKIPKEPRSINEISKIGKMNKQEYNSLVKSSSPLKQQSFMASSKQEYNSLVKSSAPLKEQSFMASSKPWLNMRLPMSILPNTYDINLNVDMENNTYSGDVTINVNVTMATDVIIMHMVGLQINRVVVTSLETGNKVVIRKTFQYEPNEFYIIKMDTVLEKDSKYDINIKYSGRMGKDLNGFYTSYTSSGNKVASTFFSPISARKAIPCFDEPSFKANFTLSLTHNATFHALSNMQPRLTCKNDGLLTTTFHTTLKMSTYILCWVISQYNHIESSDKRIRAWSMNVEDVRFGLENGEKLLSFYEDYFKIAFPLKKLDVVSIPSFGPGAMENWGINTFRAERILINRKTSPEILQQKSFNLMAHEFTHQWFGNLVTMKFWNDAWLKEGFANNIGAIGGHHVDKNMGSKEQVLANFMLPALEVDSYATSHPISSDLKTPSDIRGVFDLITYNKGSCLVDLLHNYIGDEDFRSGLQYYLKTYAYGNADQEDLWGALSHVSGKDVKSVMDTWTLQLGYPVVSVKRINDSFVEISQKRFSLDARGTAVPPSPFNYIWKVPIIFKSPSTDERMQYLLEEQTAMIRIPKRFTILNPDHSLFYRVNYDDSMHYGINKVQEMTKLTSQDRTGLISDRFSFVAAKMTDIGTTLRFLSYLKQETDYYPWKVALEQLSYIRTLLTKKAMKEKFNTYIKELMSDMVRKVGWGNTKTVNQGSLQVLLLSEACQVGSNEVYVQAKRYFEKWMMNPDHITLRPSLLPVIMDCAISNGPDVYWNFAYYKYRYLVSKGESADSMLWALTSTNKIPMVKKMLALSLDNSIIDSQYTPYVISKLAQGSYEARVLCWEYIKEHWSVIFERYGRDIFMLSDMLSAVLNDFSTEELLNNIKTFFAGRDVGSGKNAVHQAFHKIEGNIEWKKDNFEDLISWMDEQL